MKEFLQINPADTVAVALQEMPGIPAGHKFALRDIAEGEDVIKYGNPIGHATRAIRKGELVDHHNIATNLSGTLDYSGLRPDPSPVGRGDPKPSKVTFPPYLTGAGEGLPSLATPVRTGRWVSATTSGSSPP